jgi:SAM-dependent methyltransferase
MRSEAMSMWDTYWRHADTTSWQPHKEIADTIIALDVAGKRVLEVGAGTGVDSIAIAERGAHAVVLDLSREALILARHNSQSNGVTLLGIQGDAFRMPFPSGAFDIVFHQGLLEHFKNPVPLLLENRRVLKRGGHLLVDVPQKYHFYTVEKHLRMLLGKWPFGWETEYSIGQLESIVAAAGFKVRSSYGHRYAYRPLLAIRHAHHFGRSRWGRPVLPHGVVDAVEKTWRSLERSRAGCYFLSSIGVLAVRDA